MIAGKSKNGFEFEINEKNLNDFRMIRMLARASKDDDITLYSEAMEKIFGEEQFERMLEFLADDKGRVPIEKISELFTDVCASVKELKNS